MNRREFQTSMISVFGVGAIAALSSVDSASASVSNAAAIAAYQYRLRFFRSGRMFYLWMRLFNSNQKSADVSARLIVATDTTGLNVVRSTAHDARAINSHIIRVQFKVGEMTGWNPGAPLYAHLRIGPNALQTKTWTLRNA